MDMIDRLINLGNYLVGSYIIIDPSKKELQVDTGIYDEKRNREIAVEYFHKTYTRKP